MDDNRNIFLIEQYKSLREEVSRRQAARNRLEEISILGIVAVYAWLATNEASIGSASALAFAWWLPTFIALTSFTRQLAITKGIDRVAEFTKLKSAEFNIPVELCWERFVSDHRRGLTFGGIRRSANILWVIIILASTTVAIAASARIMNANNLNDKELEVSSG